VRRREEGMGAAEQIASGIYLVGGPEISHAEDATVKRGE
jgi:hypothetical protein